VLIFTKGAPEIVMEYCTSYFDSEGEIKALDTTSKTRIIKEIVTNCFAKKAYRTLLIAFA